MTRPILLDVESRSRADLKKIGGRLYWQHPSSEILVLVWYDVEAEDLGIWYPGDATPQPIADAIAGRARLVAHNARGFDRFPLERFLDVPTDHDWIDSANLCRRAGLPGSLDALGTRLLGIPKDHAASRFTVGLSTVRRPTKATAERAPGGSEITPDGWRLLSKQEKREAGVLPIVAPDDLERVTDYCVSDVEIMAEAWTEHLAPWLDVDVETEKVCRVVNDRGVYFDQPLARALLKCDQRNADRAIASVAERLEMPPEAVRAIAGSPEQFTAYTGLPDAQKGTLEKALLGVDTESLPEGEEWAYMCLARQALASIAKGKLEAGLARVSADSRLRDTLRYYGAHTGRWSGSGIQPQNLPRPDERGEKMPHAELDALAVAVTEGRHHATPAEIDLLLRATLCASPGHILAVEDFSGVEARALAWCADDWDALDVFKSGRDPYKVAASAIFGVAYEEVTKAQRHVGKQAELACGYGQGWKKFAETAAKAGADLAGQGVDAKTVVDTWRTQHAPIVRFWRRLEQAFVAACRGRRGEVDCFELVPSDDGTAVAIFLPSERPICYNDVQLHKGKFGPQASYLNTKGREYTYGGKLTENVIQALCRDMLAHCLDKVERRGLNPVMHVHDEIVCEVPDDSGGPAGEELHRIMSQPPIWAATFPLGAAGFVGRRYRK